MRKVRLAIFLAVALLVMGGSSMAEDGAQAASEDTGRAKGPEGPADIPRFMPRYDTAAPGNFIRNASFECGGDLWSSLGKQTGWGGDLSGLYGVVESGDAWDGHYCLRIDMGPGVTPTTYFDVWPPSHDAQHAPLAANVGWMAVTRGEPITLSAYLKSSVAGTKARFLFRFAKNALGAIQQATHEVVLSQDWIRYTVTQTALDDDVCIAVGPDMTGMPDRAASFRIDAVQLETGSEATVFKTHEPVEAGITTGHYGNVYHESEPITLHVFADNRGGGNVPVVFTLELEDYFGTALAPQHFTLDMPTEGPAHVPWVISVPGKGHYRATVQWAANGCNHTRVFAFTVIEPYPHDDSPFGLNHPATSDTQLKLLSTAGIRWVRNWAVNWEWVEPVPGPFSWDEQDAQQQYLSAAGMRTLCVFPNPSTNWASTAPSSVEQKLWYRMAYRPADPQRLFDFIGKAVERYPKQCIHWEFLNEPLWVPDFCLPKSGGYTVADYITLLKGAFGAIKTANPAAVVIAGLATEPESRLGDEFIEAGGLQYCDIFNLHPYGRLIVPEDFIERMERTQKAMAASGEQKPIWATETAYYGVDDKPWTPWVAPPDHFSAGLLWPSERNAADCLVRHAIIMLAHGVEKIFYHEPINGPVNNGTMDIENTFLGPDAVPKKSFAAIAALANRLGPSPQYAGELAGAEATGIYGYAFQCGGRAVLAAWAPRPRPPHAPATCGIQAPQGCHWYDVMGNKVDGGRMTLSESPVYLQSDGLTAVALLAACTVTTDIPLDEGTRR